MTRGRKPKPTALKLVDGNPGKRAINRSEPKPAEGAPTCPSWLPVEAKAEWKRVVPELERIGVLTKVDRGALAAYCQAWATLKAAEAEIAEHGIVTLEQERVFEDPDAGTFVIYVRSAPNPAVKMAKDAAQTVRLFCAEFGLTPSARSRMTVKHGGEENPKERLLSS